MLKDKGAQVALCNAMELPIYLDYASTTPVDPRVKEAMLPYFDEIFGNASSNHITENKLRKL